MTEEEEINRWYDDTEKIYRAKVTGRHAVTLPAELCRELRIEAGDSVEFRLRYGGVTLSKAGDQAPVDRIDPVGILAGYFDSMEAVNRYIREGRGTWTEEDEAEYQRNRRSEPAATSSS